MSQKKNEGIPFSAEIRVVGSYTDRLLSSKYGQTAKVKPQTANRGLPFVVRWPNLDLVRSLIRQTKNAKRACILAIDHLRFPKSFPFKTRLNAKPFLWKWVLFGRECILMALHLASLWNWGFGQLGMALMHDYVSWANFTTKPRL